MISGPLGAVAAYSGHPLRPGLSPEALKQRVFLLRVVVKGPMIPKLNVYSRGTEKLGLKPGSGTSDPAGAPKRVGAAYAYDSQIVEMGTLPAGRHPVSIAISTDGRTAQTVASGLSLVAGRGVETQVSTNALQPQLTSSIADSFGLI